MLIIFGGLPGAGKTTMARELARQICAVLLRIDSIEQATRAFGVVSQPLNDLGYRVAHAVAQDNLRIGRTVIADSVIPLQLARDAWVAVANTLQISFVEIEIICSDPDEHRHRIETRIVDIPGLRPATWEDVTSREYHPWNREHLVIDTAGRAVLESAKMIREALPDLTPQTDDHLRSIDFSRNPSRVSSIRET
jgi:predicted kinase